MTATKLPSRKRVYVSSQIQGRLLLRFCTYWLGYHAFLLLALLLNAILASTHPQSLAELFSTIWQQHFWAIAIVTAAFPVLFRDILITTHRIAGPLVRFEKVVKELTRGNSVTPIKLRKHDMLTEFQDALNEFIESQNKQQRMQSDAAYSLSQNEDAADLVASIPSPGVTHDE